MSIYKLCPVHVCSLRVVEPVISQLTRHREVNSGEAALLQCKAGGYPRPKVFWTHLASGTRIASKILNLTRVEAKDGGEYECTAHNTHGQAKGKTMLTVSGMLVVDKRIVLQCCMPLVPDLLGSSISVPSHQCCWPMDHKYTMVHTAWEHTMPSPPPPISMNQTTKH